MSLKKPKKIKKKVFEKDIDEHFVVIIKPFRDGRKRPWDKIDTNIIAEWLRRAIGSRRQSVHAVYTLSSVRSYLTNQWMELKGIIRGMRLL